MDDVLLQLIQNFFSGSRNDEGHGVGVSQGVVLAEHLYQAAADLTVRGEFHFSGVIIQEQDTPGCFVDAHLQQGAVQFVDIGWQVLFQNSPILARDS